MSTFEQASRLKLRFDSARGLLTTEDLWDLPLTSNSSGVNLDNLAIELHNSLKTEEDVSFVTPVKKPMSHNQLRFDIVKYIIDVRLAERDAATLQKATKERKEKILAILAQKEDQSLMQAPAEELRKMVESL
jgi:hypothetical protein